MRYGILTIFLLVSWEGLGQKSQYSVPKYPPKIKMNTREIGIRPGSKVPQNGPETTVFQRIYSYPAGLRVLVRAECNKRIGRQELIERAEQVSLPDGPPVQVDWDAVRDNRVSFWAVVYARRETLTINLVANGGKYAVENKRTSKQETWDVQRIVLPKSGANCVNEKELLERDLRIAVINILTNASLRNFRQRPSP